MPAPAKNQNATKEEADKVATITKVRSLPSERKAWLRAAGGEKINTWMRRALNAAAERTSRRT